MTFPQPYEVADEGWLPTLLEVNRWASEGGPDGEYFSRFGWGGLDCPDSCPHVNARMDELGMNFLGRYGDRMLGYETMEKWQRHLEQRFYDNVFVFERMYRLYEQYDAQMGVPIRSETTSREHTLDRTVAMTGSHGTVDSGNDTVTGSGSSGSTAKHADTPDTLVNLSSDYGSAVDKTDDTNQSTASTAYGKHTDATIDDHTTDGTVENDSLIHTYNGDAVARVNENIEAYRNIDKEFIDKFESLFLNLFCYGE